MTTSESRMSQEGLAHPVLCHGNCVPVYSRWEFQLQVKTSDIVCTVARLDLRDEQALYCDNILVARARVIGFINANSDEKLALSDDVL